MKKKNKMPKVVMAASVAVLGIGLFSTLQNEAHATGSGGDCVVCGDTNEQDCMRVIVDNETHYFAGPRSECD